MTKQNDEKIGITSKLRKILLKTAHFQRSVWDDYEGQVLDGIRAKIYWFNHTLRMSFEEEKYIPDGVKITFYYFPEDAKRKIVQEFNSKQQEEIIRAKWLIERIKQEEKNLHNAKIKRKAKKKKD